MNLSLPKDLAFLKFSLIQKFLTSSQNIYLYSQDEFDLRKLSKIPSLRPPKLLRQLPSSEKYRNYLKFQEKQYRWMVNEISN